VYFGFRAVEMFVSGRGVYDGDGNPVDGGPGRGRAERMPTWLMMLDP
jgi:hypothetical protein